MWPSFPVWLASLPDTQPRVRPALHAGILTVGYLVAAGGYILLSSQMAARASGTVEELERLEVVKGSLFVLVTGTAFFGLTLFLLTRLRRREREVAESTRALIQAERTALSALLAGSIAHDIRNALVVAQLGLESVDGAEDERERRASIVQTRGALNSIAALSTRLMRVGREAASERAQSFPVAMPIESALRLVSDHVAVRATRFTHEGVEADAVATGTPDLISRSLVNLVLNAAEATGKGGHVVMRHRVEGERLIIEVEDDGPGIGPEWLDTIFDAFYSTKDRGSGLGLISVRACASQHGGTVEVDRSPTLGGARFRLTLPIVGTA